MAFAAWFQGKPSIVWRCLTPALWLLSEVVRWVGNRRAAQQAAQPPLRHPHDGRVVEVWAIGNWLVGGAGKTPLTQALCADLAKAGRRPGVVSRGVGRAAEANAQAEVVIPAGGNNSAGLLAGDEPALIAHRCHVPVAVGPNRRKAALALLMEAPETDLILLDDGLTQTGLRPSRRIAIIDERLHGNQRLLPLGPLRRPWPPYATETPQLLVFRESAALQAARRTGLLADSATRGSSGNASALGTWEGESAVLCMPIAGLQALGLGPDGRLARLALQPMESLHAMHTTGAAGQSADVHAMAGIAVPERFFQSLAEQGLQVCRTGTLPDHAAGIVAAVDHLLEGLPPDDPRPVLITEKDQAKLLAELATRQDEGLGLPPWLGRCLAVVLQPTLEPLNPPHPLNPTH